MNKGTLLLAIGIIGAAALAACGGGKAAATPGHEKKVGTAMLESAAEALQDLSPVRGIDYYLDAFHVMRDDPSYMMEAHHYCRDVTEELTQCVLFDGLGKNAHLVGVEYIVSERLFESLPPDEKKSWHPHNYEILSGQLMLPGVPEAAEKAALKKKMNSYGKTWHFWDTGHWDEPRGDALPIGAPMLAWSFNRDGEIPEALLEQRDRRLDVRTADRRRALADLSAIARPQMGVDLLRSKLHGHGAPPGVVDKAGR